MAFRFFVFLFFLAACEDSSLTFRSQSSKVETQSQAATTHLAVLSRKLYTNETVKALLPNFPMDGQKAFDNSVPVTGDFRALRSSAATGNISIEVNPGTVSTPEGPQASANDPSPIKQESRDVKAADARTTYSNATGLFQDVASLNNYIRNYPSIDGHLPYVVRLQLSVIPRRRNLPYDVYSDLSFFADLGKPGQTRYDRSAREKDPSLADEISIVPAIPLFATEAVEAGQDQASLDRIRSASLSGAGTAGIFSLGGGLSAEQKSLIQALTNEINGLFTLGRVTENVIRVRFGAVQNAESSYEMIPRTHNVMLLLMIPEGTSTVNIKAQQSMINVETFEALPPGINNDAFYARISGIFKRFRLVKGIDKSKNTTDNEWNFLCKFRENTKRLGVIIGKTREETDARRRLVSFVLKRMRPDVAHGDFQTFKQRIWHCLERSDADDPRYLEEVNLDYFDVAEYSRILWTELATIQAELPDSFASFQVPGATDVLPADSEAEWTSSQAIGGTGRPKSPASKPKTKAASANKSIKK